MSVTEEYSFWLVGADWELRFSESVIALLSSHAQRLWYQRESVGQLFASDLTGRVVLVDAATILRPRRSTWANVTFDFEEAREQRNTMFREGKYCVGLWHTHPEACPAPSVADERLAADHAQAARPVLNGLVFAILGNRTFPEDWYVGVHDGQRFHLTECNVSVMR